MSIHGWDGFKPYGIQFLTGEADPYGFRGLFDLNEKGVEILNSFFGGNITFAENSNWNFMVGDKPAIASVMLPYSIYEALSIFCLFCKGFYGVLVSCDKTFTGVTKEYFENNRDYFQNISKTGGKFIRNFNYNHNPSVSTKDGRNIHQFSGRDK